MNKELTFTKSIVINAGTDMVWQALTDREIIKKYFFGTEAISDWKVGSTLVFQGEWEGKKYQDKGNILAVESGRLLQYNYWSGFSGLEDTEENYSLVTYRLKPGGKGTSVILTQEGFASEEALSHAAGAWSMVLDNMKKLIENSD